MAMAMAKSKQKSGFDYTEKVINYHTSRKLHDFDFGYSLVSHISQLNQRHNSLTNTYISMGNPL